MLYEVITRNRDPGWSMLLSVAMHLMKRNLRFDWRAWLRITSYNVCYTKLLRGLLQDVGGKPVAIVCEGKILTEKRPSTLFSLERRADDNLARIDHIV